MVWALHKFMADGSGSTSSWEGTTSELLIALNSLVGEQVQRSRFWPSKANGLGMALQRCAPLLRRQGIRVKKVRTAAERVLALRWTRTDHSEHCSKSEFARRIGLSPGRISQLIELGLPVSADGRIEVASASAWYGENMGPGRRGRIGDAGRRSLELRRERDAWLAWSRNAAEAIAASTGADIIPLLRQMYDLTRQQFDALALAAEGSVEARSHPLHSGEDLDDLAARQVEGRRADASHCTGFPSWRPAPSQGRFTPPLTVEPSRRRARHIMERKPSQ